MAFDPRVTKGKWNTYDTRTRTILLTILFTNTFEIPFTIPFTIPFKIVM